MPDPANFRDSTQIVLPCEVVAEFCDEIEAEYTVSVHGGDDGTCRIIGSPVEIKQVSQYLTRRGVFHP
jgi:hypothetical protein